MLLRWPADRGCPDFHIDPLQARRECAAPHPLQRSVTRCILSVRSVMVLGLVLGLTLGTANVFASNETLELRNTSPIAQTFGLPAHRGARADGWETRFSLDMANSFTGDFTDTEFAFLDGETATFAYTLRRDFAERWEFGVELPWVVHSGGRFDRVIDEFHDLFGLPDGGRPLAERGALDYVVRVDGVQEVDIRQKTSDLGDVRGWLARGLYEAPGRDLVARLHVKAPTGRARHLSGSGGLDVAVGLDYVDQALLDSVAVQISLGGGLAYLGEGNLIEARQEHVVPYGHFGLSWGLGEQRRVRVIGQLDAHGALFDAQLSHLGKPVLQGTLGLQYSLTPKLSMDLSLLEDLSGALASDAIFKFTISGQL